jgi:hypothetical protein
MPVVISLDVLPLHAQVALLDATWQDYPDWADGDEQVAVRAPSLANPDLPPYPGFAVATRPDTASGRWQMVRVEVWAGERPDGLRMIRDSVLHVGRAGDSGRQRRVPACAAEPAWRQLAAGDLGRWRTPRRSQQGSFRPADTCLIRVWQFVTMRAGAANSGPRRPA